MPYDRLPDMTALLAATARVAAAMGHPPADEARARRFLQGVLYPDEGGRDLWGCLMAGLCTEIEVRDALMARVATWLSYENDAREPPCDQWGSPEIERDFESALYGRPADREEHERMLREMERFEAAIRR
jgi:hypothetical protein